MQFKMVAGFTGTKDYDVCMLLPPAFGKSLQQSSLFAAQAVEHVRTVASLGQMAYFFESYKSVRAEQAKRHHELILF